VLEALSGILEFVMKLIYISTFLENLYLFFVTSIGETTVTPVIPAKEPARK
jgi:hypothetical protein